MCVCVRACVRACVRVHVCVCVRACVRTRVRACVRVHVRVYVFVCCVCVCVTACAHTCVRECVPVSVVFYIIIIIRCTTQRRIIDVGLLLRMTKMTIVATTARPTITATRDATVLVTCVEFTLPPAVPGTDGKPVDLHTAQLVQNTCKIM